MNLRKSTKLVLTIIGIAAPLFLIGNYSGYSKSDVTPQVQTNNKTFKLVVIDPGHGGKLPGAYGKISAEKDIVLQVAKKLKDSIEKNIPGVKAILTRETDIDVPFHERSNIANRNHADLFISIHCNSANSRSEEHTSELQSRENLVCRLLLEKKNNMNNQNSDMAISIYLVKCSIRRKVIL